MLKVIMISAGYTDSFRPLIKSDLSEHIYDNHYNIFAIFLFKAAFTTHLSRLSVLNQSIHFNYYLTFRPVLFISLGKINFRIPLAGSFLN